MPFSKLQIHSTLIETIGELGYSSPTPVQSEVMPKIIEGADLRVSAPTGTGKTAAFLLPAITRLLTSHSSREKNNGPKILVLVPTRELALQVASSAEKYSRAFKRMKTVCIYGGVSYDKQYKDLRSPHEIIVATPGRLIDLISRRKVSLKHIEILILDEADRMLDMGFSEPVQEIAKLIPPSRQTLLFSATLKGNVLELSSKLLSNPEEIIISLDIDKEANIEERLLYVDDIHHKLKLLDHLLKNEKVEQAIVFTSTKRLADMLTTSLIEKKHSAAKLHGDMNQRQRTKTIMQLRNGKIQILVATDVAARGIDIKSVSHVINFDLPMTGEEYIHRIGRTARAGAAGKALTFATKGQRGIIKSIEKFTGKALKVDVIAGLESKKDGKDESFFRKKRFGNKQKKIAPRKKRNPRPS